MQKIILVTLILFLLKPHQAISQNAELVTQKTNIELLGGKLTSNYYFEIRINNRAGEKYTKISIPYSKLSKISNIDAYLKDSNGKNIRKLKSSEIVNRSSISNFSFYEDNFIKEFTLKHNIYPYTIVYSYQIQESEFLHLAYWCPVLDFKIPTHNARLDVTIPVQYEVFFSSQLVNNPDIYKFEKTAQYIWQTDYKKFISEREEFSPPIEKNLPYVIIVPKTFKFGIAGSFDSWINYGNWQSELIKNLNDIPPSEKQKVNELIRNFDTDKEKVRALYHYLQDETRYINVSIETGGLKPYPASYVALNKYGDCKALTNYLKSLLDFAGIKSYYTKVHAGNPIREINKNFPSQQSNHIILFVPLQKDTLWLDCTSKGPFNYLGTFTQNRDAFIIDNNNSSFIKTPALKKTQVIESRNIKISFSQNLDAQLIFNNNYRGELFEVLDQINRGYNESDKLLIIRNNFVDNELELKDYSITRQHRDSTSIALSYNASSKSLLKIYGNDALVSNISFSLPHFEKPENRTLPVQIDYPIYKVDTITYNPLQGFSLQKIPVNHTFSSKFGKYKIEFSQKDKNIVVIKTFILNPGTITIDEYKAFYNFYIKVYDLEKRTHIALSK